jgi:hypothetical protein
VNFRQIQNTLSESAKENEIWRWPAEQKNVVYSNRDVIDRSYQVTFDWTACLCKQTIRLVKKKKTGKRLTTLNYLPHRWDFVQSTIVTFKKYVEMSKIKKKFL